MIISGDFHLKWIIMKTKVGGGRGAKNLTTIRRSIQKNSKKRNNPDTDKKSDDYSWVIPGALAISKFHLFANGEVKSTNGEPFKMLAKVTEGGLAWIGPADYSVGTPFVFSHSIRSTIKSRSGPMRVVYHVWISPKGEKYTMPLDYLQAAGEEQ